MNGTHIVGLFSHPDLDSDKLSSRARCGAGVLPADVVVEEYAATR
jgi:hypothetical protein